MRNDNSKTTTTWNCNNNNRVGASDITCISNLSSPTLSNLCWFLSVVIVATVYVVFLIVHLPLCIHNNRWRTRKLHNNNNSNIQIHLQKLFHIFWIIHLFMMIITVIYINCSVCRSSYFLYNSETWTLHLKSSWSSVHIILLWEVYLSTSSDKLT